MWDVSPTTHSMKLQLVYGLRMCKTATLDTFTGHSNFVHVVRIWIVAALKEGRGKCPPAPMKPYKLFNFADHSDSHAKGTWSNQIIIIGAYDSIEQDQSAQIHQTLSMLEDGVWE